MVFLIFSEIPASLVIGRPVAGARVAVPVRDS
jgi:hypothetical protein